MGKKFANAADFRKSIEARIEKERARTNMSIQRLRRHLTFDRFLARFPQDVMDPKWVVKGGYAMELRLRDKARMTKDLDFTCTLRPKSDTSTEILDGLRDMTSIELQDHFLFEVEQTQELDGPAYGGVRFTVTGMVSNRIFETFQVDVGLEHVLLPVERSNSTDWLGFCGVTPPVIHMIAAEQQFAEKIHAYSLPRDSGFNNRVKDLVDMVLLLRLRPMDLYVLRNCAEQLFRLRATHPLPEKLLAPPDGWEAPFRKMAQECGLVVTLARAFDLVSAEYDKMLLS
jgi:predicted nucleotidyltransferase component of viral defense system